MIETLPFFLTSEFSDLNTMEPSFDLKAKMEGKSILKAKGGIRSSFLTMKS